MNRFKRIATIICILIALISTSSFCEDNSLNIWYPLLNTLPGFGIGSFIQGDISSGLTCTMGELAGISLMAAPTILFGGQSIDNYENHEHDSLFILGGFGLYALAKVYGITNSIGNQYGYKSEVTGLLNILPAFGLNAFLNKDIWGGLFLLGLNSYSTMLIYNGIKNDTDNLLLNGIAGFIIAGLYGHLRSYEYQFGINMSLPLVLNIIPGFGLGSLIQGDLATAALCCIGDLVGLGAMSLGMISVFASLIPHASFGSVFSIEFLLVGGAITFVVSKFYGLSKTIDYGFKHRKTNKNTNTVNNNLSGQAGINGILENIDIKPDITIFPKESGGLGIKLGFCINL